MSGVFVRLLKLLLLPFWKLCLNSKNKQGVIMTTQALAFQNTQFDVVDRNNQPWLRGCQIGTALGYTQATQAISKIFERNKDEFTDSMTALVELDTDGGKQQVRIFSLRGCHLLGMLSKTKIAKQFRVWVLDVLESLAVPTETTQPTSPITGKLLLEMHNGKIVSCTPIAEGTWIFDPRSAPSVGKLVLDYIPAQHLPRLIEIATKRLLSIHPI